MFYAQSVITVISQRDRDRDRETERGGRQRERERERSKILTFSQQHWVTSGRRENTHEGGEHTWLQTINGSEPGTLATLAGKPFKQPVVSSALPDTLGIIYTMIVV